MLNAIDFLPSNIKLFTKRVTNVSLNRGSGSNGRFLALAFLMSSYLEVVYFFGFLAPYFERRWVLPSTPAVSRAPRTMW